MRTATYYSNRRRLTVSVSVALLSALLVTVSGVVPAAAATKDINFQVDTSTTPEGSPSNILVVLTHDGPPATPMVVTISATPGTASANDYSLSPNTVTFPINSPSGTAIPVPLTFTPDDVYENNETLSLAITSVSGGSIGPVNTHAVTILNDDDAPTLSISDASRAEGTGAMVFTVTREGLTDLTATAVATPSSGTAQANDDFGSAVGGISIAPGGPTGIDTFEVQLVNDDIYEPNETFNVNLSGFFASRAGDATAVGTIVDNDTPPTLSIDDVTVHESDSTATFTITRTGRTAFDTGFYISTSGVEATEGLDFTGQADTLTISPGGVTATKAHNIPITDDDLAEQTETFRVNLTNPVRGTLLKATGTGTITDNDTAGITVNQLDGLFVLEGSVADTFNMVLDSEPTSEVIITLSTAVDQVTVDPTVVKFDSTNWNVPRPITVTAIEDGVDEDDPHKSSISLSVTAIDPNYSAVKLPDVTVTIGDADSLLVTIDGPAVGAPGDLVTFTAVVNAGATGDITYTWTAFYLGNEIAHGNQSVFSFTPNEGGPYIVQVVVGDSEGQNPVEFIPFRALSDVSGSVFVDDIVWLAENEITKGCNPPVNDMFCPTDAVTRGQMAAFLVRFLGLSDDGGGNTFTDDNNSIFETDIAKLATAGITKGCNPPANTQFCPDAPVTREQMAAFLVRAIGLTDDGGGNTFTDDNNSIFETDITKLATAGITKGCNPPTNNKFCPRAPVTREQMAAFIRRADQILNP